MADQTFAVHCGFFDAINSDRTYSADEMNRPYKRVISNGVFATPNGTPSTDLQVTASSGMNIICKKGEGLFGDKWFENPSGIAITVPSNTGTVPRIDSVLVQVDTRTSGRVGNIVHRTGTPASSPVPPSINQVEGVVEYRLANIRVNAGVSAITQSMITDRRGSSDCPWVTSLIYQVDTSTLYDQWQAAYAEYFEEEKAIWDAWYSQLTEDLDVSMTLDRHTNTVTTTAQTTGTIPIGLAYNHNTDILEVYINGLRAIEGTHYVVVDGDTSIQVENQLQIGQTVTFVVMRSVISGSATNIMVLLQELESQIAGVAGGTPTVVDAKADMTEHDKIYILSSDSKWYYYSATAEDWVIGGTYGGVPTDTTLTQQGRAADAKAVGDALADKADSDDVTALDTRVIAVEGDIDDLKEDLGQRTKQLFNKNEAVVLDGFPNNNTNYNQASTTAKSFVIPVDSANGSYVTVHREILTSRFFLATSTVTPTTTSAVTNVVTANSDLTASIPIDSNTHYLIVYAYNSANTPDSTKTLSEVADGIMVQYGQTYTGYEPYYVSKVADGQITESKLSNAVREKIAFGGIQEIIFDKEFNLWGSSLLPVQNGKRISGYNTTTYAIETTSAYGYSCAIMDIPDNIDKIKVKVSSTTLTAGQAYVAVSDTLAKATNRHNNTLASSFRDKVSEYNYGDGYYILDLAELRNEGFEKLGIGAYGSDPMYVETYKVVSPWLTYEPDIFCPIGAFGSIGAIGDSYTAGSIVKNNNTWVDVPAQAWVAVMAKRAGINYSNYGKGGANTKTYITDKLPDVLAAEANDLYFLALGINDSAQGASYIGSISDIHDADYTQNADTFYGNYGKIIAQVKAHAPNARFCMIKTPIYLAIGVELDEAIEEIADHYGFACIDPKDDPFFHSKTFYTRVSNHPSCIGYAGMAVAYERLLSKAIEKNPLYFFYSNIDANIPTDVS